MNKSKAPLLFLLLFVFFYSCTTPKKEATTSSAPITAEEKKIAKQLIQGIFDDVWGGLDSTKILDYHTEDFFILENGELWRNQEIRDFVKKSLDSGADTKRTNRMEYITIEKHGNAISMAYDNYANFYQKDSLIAQGQWLESALAVPTSEGWRLRMMHSTWVPKRK